MKKPSELQIKGLYELIDRWEARDGFGAASFRKQADEEIANGSLTEIGAINLIKELRHMISVRG